MQATLPQVFQVIGLVRQIQEQRLAAYEVAMGALVESDGCEVVIGTLVDSDGCVCEHEVSNGTLGHAKRV